MTLLLVFSVTLVAAVLVSEIADRTILSTTVLFLVAGFIAGGHLLNLIPETSQDPIVVGLAALALFAVLLTDGMRVPLHYLRTAWQEPARLLLIGLPLTLVGGALLARVLGHFTWTEALLVGAALSPTDPVFAAAIVGREEMPSRVRDLLNVESGLNDGLSLPIVLILLTAVSGKGPHVPVVLGELALGVGLGVLVPLVFLRLEKMQAFNPTSAYLPMYGFAVGLVILAVTSLTRANSFLAAFAAGITINAYSPATREAFHRFGDLVAELLKLASVLVFGSLLATDLMGGGVSWATLLFAAGVLLLVRPAAVAVALVGTRLGRRQWLTVAWFGPKGFASLIFALLIVSSGATHSRGMFQFIAITIGLSIILHSSTDVPVARMFPCDDGVASQRPLEDEAPPD